MIRIVADTSTLYSTRQAKDAGFDVSPPVCYDQQPDLSGV